MSEVKLVLRDRNRDISGTIHGSMADRAIAALTAEPETIEELEVAMQRFYIASGHRHFGWFRSGIDDEPYDAGIVIIDLAARFLASESTYSSAGREGCVWYHDGQSATDIDIRYRLSNDWLAAWDTNAWKRQADERRRDRLASPPIDTRAMLLGKPMVEFIAREIFTAFRDRAADAEPTEEFWGDEYMPASASRADFSSVKAIHGRWLTTPREDLRNVAPREVLLSHHDFIDHDVSRRSEEWAQLNECPRGLDPKSWAYLYAGYGTHQIVVYYYLMRFLLWSCYDALLGIPVKDRAGMTVGDFLTTEVPRLTDMREEYLDTPNPEYSGRTPREVMDHERARIPEGGSGKEHIIDCDCPLCQMQAEMPGPMFWHLDGCNMDDEFAFSFCLTQEEWDAKQREYEEYNRRFEAKQAERKRLGVEYPGGGYGDPEYVWKRSFAAPESEQTSLTMRLFAIGTFLGELTCDLKEPTEDRPLVDRLSRDWGNLREVVGATEASAEVSLIDPVLDCFCESLAEVAAAHPDLEPKCSDLSARLRRFTEPPAQQPDEADYMDEDGLPF